VVSSAGVHAVVESPLAPLLLVGDGDVLSGLYVLRDGEPRPLPPGSQRDDAAFEEARRQLAGYFDGTRRGFDLRLRLEGTPWQLRVWDALREIPYGTTTTYGALARELGRPAAARAVGSANAHNPISIVVPCHRLVGSTGSLTGYGGGLERKRALLDLEAAVAGL
jgi:methylated-DNA-[protein]-cysteine S-methyltransferase